MDYYYFVHGFPTAAPALFSNPATRTSNCQCTGEVDSHGFYDLWVQQFLDAGATSANLLQQECLHCSAERNRRQRVLGAPFEQDETFHKPPFDTAPALYAFNVPRYYTLRLRAWQYARTNNRRSHWCMARDIPLLRDDRDLPPEQLDEKRRG